MAILSFFATGAIEAFHARGIGRVRLAEVLASGTSTAEALGGEICIVTNDGDGVVKVAVGSTPNANATTATIATTAYFPILPGSQSPPFVMRAGDKIAIG